MIRNPPSEDDLKSLQQSAEAEQALTVDGPSRNTGIEPEYAAEGARPDPLPDDTDDASLDGSDALLDNIIDEFDKLVT